MLRNLSIPFASKRFLIFFVLQRYLGIVNRLHRTDEPCRCVNMRGWFQVKAGHYTVAGIDQDHGRYSAIAGGCESTSGPFTNGTYLWAQFRDLDAWERKLVQGPYIHHVSEVAGDYTAEIKEFCKYVSNIKFETV